MKTRFVTLAAVSAAILAIVACGEKNDIHGPERQEVQEIVMTPASITLKEGTSAYLSARISKWNAASGRTVEWESADPGTATVNGDGLVQAVSIGETEVKAHAGGKTGVCRVSVVSSRIPAETVSVTPGQVSIHEGSSVTLSATVNPSSSTDVPVWSTEDNGIVDIDQSGKLVAKSSGYAKVKVTAGDAIAEVIVLSHGDIWLEQVDPLIRPVSFEDHPFETDTIRVARGETATVQMKAYCSTEQGTVVPSVTRFAPAGSDGVVIEPKLSWVRSIKCTDHWDKWAGGRAPDAYPAEKTYIPDVLMPLEDWPVDLPKGNQTAFWAEFDIPRDIAPGIYEGTARITGNDTGELPFVIEIYDVTLPEKQTLDIMQWINPDLRAMNGGESVEMYGVYERIENIIVPFVSKYGQNCFNTQYARRNTFPQTLVKNASGEYEMKADFSGLGKEIEMYLRACPDLHYVQGYNVISSAPSDGMILILGYELNEDGSIKVTDNGDGTYTPEFTYVEQRDQHSPEAEAYFTRYFHALQEYLRSKKLPDGRTWLSIYLQTLCDEPSDAVAPAWSRLAGYLKKGAPELKVMEPVGTHLIPQELIDIPCPCIDVLKGDNGYEFGEDQTAWIYSAVGPQGTAMNRFIRIPLIKTRLLQWLNYRYSTTGFLHWGLNYWAGAPGGDPWKDANGAYIGGDMWIIWPGDGKVYPSPRLAAMRDGIRDFELMTMLGKQSSGDSMGICRSIVTDTFNYSTDVKQFRQARKEILDRLSSR